MSILGNSLVLFDQEKSRQGQLIVAGTDEAGRGCWAGPVVAAAVILPAGWIPNGLDDSKKLTAKKREVFCKEICASALSWGACAVSPAEIDRINILQASLQAMARSAQKLKPTPDLLLVDGLQIPPVQINSEAIVKGDGTSAAIAAASVVAKVLRDKIMQVWDLRYPGYGFASNKGYGAAEHQAGLKKLGACPIHRFSYKPIAQLRQNSLF